MLPLQFDVCQKILRLLEKLDHQLSWMFVYNKCKIKYLIGKSRLLFMLLVEFKFLYTTQRYETH